LRRCQRYYEHDPTGSGHIWAYPISNSSDGYRRAPIYFKVPKRASPSTNVTSTGNTAPTVNQNMSTNGFAVAWNGVSDGNYKEVTSWTANSEL
jgi:hypothetical protein